ncbi:MAG: hypothetical protein OXO49_08310 [Gammaproteobacteria bacterium]|nr:hypothetical protein [Gammaproteobacteria bacterium]MDE0251524.1 hypothetical protein [Gammaproteobacteria bacterium]MDE0403466.1 hypothetical protein [Gammaproteobacteria bacterium]
MSQNLIFNSLLVITSVVVLGILVMPRLRKSEVWQATLTPLSSIIGSGFLVMAPLLAGIVGLNAPYAIVGIILVAYSIGHVIRYNIKYVEAHHPSHAHLIERLREPEYLGNVVLVVAYVIAVAFYLSLLSDFFLNYLLTALDREYLIRGIDNDVIERLITTAVIIFIAFVGYFRGLKGLEKLEGYSITIQLSVVVALILGLLMFNVNFEGEVSFIRNERPLLVQMQMLAGVLLIVQGFETSRFLGDAYSPEVRIKSMRIAQLISGGIFIATVFLLMPALQEIDLVHIELSAIIQAMIPVALVLPVMLVIAALMSQFSAAVADTSGGGGLLHENSEGRLSTKLGYVVVTAAAVLLVWTFDLLHIVALASRAFAAYYFLQTILALVHNTKAGLFRSKAAVFHEILFIILAVILGFVVLFSIPAE